MTRYLLPQPMELTSLDGTFTLDADTLILLSDQAGDDVIFTAHQLQEEIRRSVGFAPSLVKAFTPPRAENTVVLLCGPEQAAAFGVEPDVIAAPQDVAGQAYVLTSGQETVILYAATTTGLFYAVQTLRQLVRRHGTALPALKVQDWPTLPYRGLMLDISRHKVPSLATLQHLVRELSHFKLNVLQLYTEHTFRFPRHPKIGADAGSLSSGDIVRLDAVCRAHHVELMPNLQSFGHARNTLTIPEYRHLAETDALWTLSPAFEETYELLDQLYGDMLPAFRSKRLNVGCDETYDLGKGASKAAAEEVGVGRVYLNHILRLRELAGRYGCQIQVWGDILLHHPELIDEVPQDVTLLDWAYAPAEAYPTVNAFAKAQRRFWVCPGVGSWNSLFPRLYGANVNIRNFVRDGVAAGADGMLNTDWGDAGHYQHMGLSWYGYLFGATQAWTGGRTTDEDFDAAFGPLFFGPNHELIMEALHRLARINELPKVHHSNRSHTVLALFDEPLTGKTVMGEEALPPETLNEMQSLAEAAASACDVLAPGHPRERTLWEMASAARLTAYAARKTRVSQTIRGLLNEIAATPRPAKENADRLYNQIRSLKRLDIELDGLCAEFERLWLARARRSEIYFSLRYFANLRTRYQAAISWLLDQRDALLSGKPLDPELTTYEVSAYRVLWQTYQDRSTW